MRKAFFAPSLVGFICIIGIMSILTSSASPNNAQELQRNVLRHMGKDNSACTIALQELLKYYEETFTVQSSQYAECVLWSAMVCQKSNDHKQCRKLINRSEKLFKEYGNGPFFGRDTINEIFRLDLLSTLENDIGRDYYALRYARQAYVLKRNYFGDESPLALASMLDLSKLYASRLRNKQSAKSHTKAFNSYVHLIRDKFCAMSDTDRETYWQTAIKYVHKTTSIAYKLGKKRSARNALIAQDAYNAVLLYKGLLLNVSTGFENFVRSKGNSRAKKLLDEKVQLLSKGGSPQQIDSIEYAIINALAQDNIHYNIPELSITWKDVQANLGNDDLAIEFFHTANNEYGALLLRKGWKYPRLISLNNDITIDKRLYSLNNLLVTYNSNIQKLPTLNEYCWKIGKAVWDDRIIDHFPRTKEGRVFFSADGLLQVVGIEYLPFIRPIEGKQVYTISEIYNLHRVSSTRILAMKQKGAQQSTASLFGGLTYRMTKNTMAKIDKSYHRKRGIDNIQFALREGAIESIEPLENTKKEINDIHQILDSNNVTSKKYIEEQGVEAAFKSLSNNSPMILHIATHGFYLKPEEILPTDSVSKHNTTDNPLKRSGLLMAGAHRAYIEHEYTSNIEDGILSAYEISQLDLSQVELAVLSACQTGLGDITADGVAGLQRGFKMAGTKCLLMSLWKVDDEATYFLMTEFYKNWIKNKKDKNEALRLAQQSLMCNKEHPEWRNPKFWAAFILLDDF